MEQGEHMKRVGLLSLSLSLTYTAGDSRAQAGDVEVEQGEHMKRVGLLSLSLSRCWRVR
jgi:hypothetical protein